MQAFLQVPAPEEACATSSYAASFPGLRQGMGKPRSRQGMVLRNLQMLPFVNCPNGTALFLGTYDSKLSLLKPLRSYVTHSNKVFPTISHLVRYDSSKFPLAGQESPFHGKGVVPPVPWPFTPEQELWPGHISSQGSTQCTLLWMQAEAKPRNLLPSSSQQECC